MYKTLIAGLVLFVLFLAMFVSVRIATVAYSAKISKMDTIMTVLLHLLWVVLLIYISSGFLNGLYQDAFGDTSWIALVLTEFYAVVMTFALAVNDGSCLYRCAGR